MNKNSIIKKVAIAIVIPLFLQAFLLIIPSIGIIYALKENALRSFKNRGNDKHIYIQNQMLQNLSNINMEVKNINASILESLENKGLSTDDLNSNYELSNEVLLNISEQFMYFATENYTTDIFLIFDTKGENKGDTELIEKEGIYICFLQYKNA